MFLNSHTLVGNICSVNTFLSTFYLANMHTSNNATYDLIPVFFRTYLVSANF